MADGAAPDDSSPRSLRTGDVVGGAYRVERLLGQGAMGLVVAAAPLAGGPLVALKLLLADHLERGEALARFEREVRLVRQLRSPHVAAILDAGFHDEHVPFMAIELLDGHDLETELQRRGPLPLVEVADLALQALDALVEAHGHGIVHRDLKPSNLFLSGPPGERTLKVLDFGISKQQSVDVSLTKTHSLIGSPLYMAPEQVLAAREVDGRADVWSLGVVIYELLVGLTPFDGTSVGVVLGNVMSAPVPPIRERRPDLPAAFDSVLTGCFERAPARRLSSLGLAR
ncbi:MAG: serine/threonine protein kinase, partial [Myxococcales bacterium]